MIYVPLFHPKVTGLFPAKNAALFNRYLLQFSIVIYTRPSSAAKVMRHRLLHGHPKPGISNRKRT